MESSDPVAAAPGSGLDNTRSIPLGNAELHLHGTGAIESPGIGRPVRVLHVLTHLIRGGTESYVLRLVRNSESGRVRHVVCHLLPGSEMASEFVEAGVTPISLGHRGPRSTVTTLRRLTQVIRQEHVDLVHTHGRADRLFGYIAALICGIPAVQSLHSIYAADRSGQVAPGLRRGFRLAAERWFEGRAVRRYVAVSDEVKDVWRDATRGTSGHRVPVEVISGGVEFDRFDDEARLGRLGSLSLDLDIAGQGPVLVSVGRMQAGKGHVDLVKMMPHVLRSHPGAVLLLVGEGAERPAVENLIAELGLNSAIRILGSRPDVPRILGLADVFVFASRSEGFAIAALEAGAAGLPVVSSALPPIERMFAEPARAIFVPPGDPLALAAATVEVLRTLDEWRIVAEQNRQFLRLRYDAGIGAEAMTRLYESVVRV
jgi:glycosyltransferase involved in cell wall biosynthesis